MSKRPLLKMKHEQIFSNRVFMQEPGLLRMRKEYTFVDMHSHTKYSHDSQTPVQALLAKAHALGIGVAVTDHQQVQGAIEAARQKKVMAIPGIEIASIEKKEILLYFYSVRELIEFHDKYIKGYITPERVPELKFNRNLVSVKCARPMEDIIDFASKYSCVKSVPHPYTYILKSSHAFFAKHKHILDKVECAEIINSTCSAAKNNRAMKWTLKHNKAFTAGSDAHTPNQLGRGLVAAKADTPAEFLDAVKKKDVMVLGQEMYRREAIRNIIEINQVKRSKGWNHI